MLSKLTRYLIQLEANNQKSKRVSIYALNVLFRLLQYKRIDLLVVGVAL